MMGFSVLHRNLDTENAGKITLCYTPEFAGKFKKACKKYNKFRSDFHEVFVEQVIRKSMNTEGHITRADTKELQRVGCDTSCRAFKAKKFWSSDLRDHRTVRLDYIFLVSKKILFLVDLRFKNNNDETNHDEKMISEIMETVKTNGYELLDS